jgi:S-formylglutathione hydrolase FrmB
MGGYGAFKLALTYPEQYAAAASLSGALDIRAVTSPRNNRNNRIWLAEMRTVFGDLSKVPGSKHDLFTLAKKLPKRQSNPGFTNAAVRKMICMPTTSASATPSVNFRSI